MCAGEVGDGIQYNFFGLLRPAAEALRGVLVMGQVVEQHVEVKPVGIGAGAGFGTVAGVAPLFKMPLHGHHEHRLAQVEGFAYAFKAGGGDHGPAVGHVAQEFLVVERVEVEVIVVLPFSFYGGAVGKAVQFVLGVAAVPADDVLHVARVEQVHEDVVAREHFLAADVAAQEGRTDADVFVYGLRQRVEREGQQPPGAHGGEAGVPAQGAAVFGRAAGGKVKLRVQVDVLVGDGDGCYGQPAEEVAEAHQRFVEVNQYIGPVPGNGVADELHAAAVAADAQEGVAHRFAEADGLVVFIGYEVGTGVGAEGRRDAFPHEGGDFAAVAAAHQYGGYFVALGPQQIAQGNGLGQVAAAFSLYGKDEFHNAVW